MSNWYSVGYKSDKVTEDRKQAAAKYGPPRVWLPPKKSVTGVFIEPQPFCFREHQYKKNGSFKNWLTCLGNGELCCQTLQSYASYLVGMYTFVNCSGWTDSDGKEHKFGLEIYPAKGKTRELLEMKNDQKGSIANRLVTITRTSDKDPNCGNDFDFDREVDVEEMFAKVNYKGKLLKDMCDRAESDKEYLEELRGLFAFDLDAEEKIVRRVPSFNFREVYAPKDLETVKGLLAGFTPREEESGSGRKGGSGGAVSADDVPF